LPRAPEGRTLRVSRKVLLLSAPEVSSAPAIVYCLLHRHLHPDRFPVQLRADMAILRPRVVAEREGARLLCRGEHPGAHLWPDGEEVEEGS
jgi:hypothetical protein